MPVSKHSKRKQSETEDSDNCFDSEDEFKIRNSKKKKMNVSSDSSDEEPLATKISPNSETGKSLTIRSEENGVETSDDDMPLSKIIKSTETDKKISVSSDSSDDDEPSANEASPNSPESSEPEPEKNEVETSDDDMPLSKMIKTTKMNGKSKKTNVCSGSSDDESIATKSSSNSPEIVKKSKPKENKVEASNEKPVSKINKKTKINQKSKKISVSSDSSDDEFLATKASPKPSEIVKSSVSKLEEDESSSSDDDSDDDKNKKSKQNSSLSSNSGNESSASKESLKHKSKKQKNGHVSSNEDEPLVNIQKSSNVKAKKAKSSSNDKIEHLKKYVRLSGIHIQSYEKFFAGCKSMKAKAEKLLSTLHEKGLKGRPTIEKCKKLRKKIETKKEISELDMSNIIQIDGRPKRGSSGITKRIAAIENSPPEKRFSRLKDIIDSEESD